MSYLKAVTSLTLATATAVAILSADTAFAQSVEDFYKGKTIKIVVGNNPGGGYDAISRIVARHMGKYIPGNPTIIVQNMSGGGGIKAANAVYNIFPADGLTIAGVSQHAPMYQILGGESAKYNPVDFVWLGSISSSNSIAFTYIPTSGVRTLEDATKKEIAVGGGGITSSSTIYGNVLNALFGTKLKLINGYEGTGLSLIAIERGELDGRAGGSYGTLEQLRPDWIKRNEVAVLVQVGSEREPAIADVPLLTELARTEEEKQITSLVTLPMIIGYGHWLRPGTPVERVEALRQAYEATSRDSDFRAEMTNMSYELRSRTAQELQAAVSQAAQIPKPMLERAKLILGW